MTWMTGDACGGIIHPRILINAWRELSKGFAGLELRLYFRWNVAHLGATAKAHSVLWSHWPAARSSAGHWADPWSDPQDPSDAPAPSVAGRSPGRSALGRCCAAPAAPPVAAAPFAAPGAGAGTSAGGGGNGPPGAAPGGGGRWGEAAGLDSSSGLVWKSVDFHLARPKAAKTVSEVSQVFIQHCDRGTIIRVRQHVCICIHQTEYLMMVHMRCLTHP